jgi:hypothetical protein
MKDNAYQYLDSEITDLHISSRDLVAFALLQIPLNLLSLSQPFSRSGLKTNMGRSIWPSACKINVATAVRHVSMCKDNLRLTNA